MTVSVRGKGRVTIRTPTYRDIKSRGAYLLGAYVLTAESSYLLVMN